MHIDTILPLRRSNRARGRARVAVAAVFACAAIAALPELARAQMLEQAWNFTPRDRAGLAVVQKQVDEGMFSRQSSTNGGGGGGIGSANSTLLICGGGESQSSAQGNSSCIILNNSTGQLEIGQDSQGNQDATASSETTQTVTTADEVADILNQESGVGTDAVTE